MDLRVALAGAVTASAAGALYFWTQQEYDRIAKETPIAIDAYVAACPGFAEKLQCVALYWYTRKTRKLHDKNPYAIIARDDPMLPGVKRTRNARVNETPTVSDKAKPPLIIGTIRMGYGHHRLAYAVAAYATNKLAEHDKNERDVYFHDIVQIGHEEAELPDEAEDLYRFASQTLSESPNLLERAISKISAGGGPNALRLQVHEAGLLTGLVAGLDKDSPLIATHPLVGAMAVAANFTRVINLVVDNHAQWFVVVPGAINLVQGPRLYRELLRMGVPPKDLQLAAHWNPKGIVDRIPESTQRRIDRVRQGKPLRLLIPVGGAGAQESFLLDLVKDCEPLVRQGKVQLFLNAGDHAHMKQAFTEQLDKLKLDFDFIQDLGGRQRVQDRLQKGQEPTKAVTLFAFNNPFAAVTTNDELIPDIDVLVCKPSEMAFYAVPKLHIRRVGDHEAKSAVRAAELGDGTLEAATVPEVMVDLHQMLNKPDDLITMNQRIQQNHQIGMYDGAKMAVEMALAS